MIKQLFVVGLQWESRGFLTPRPSVCKKAFIIQFQYLRIKWTKAEPVHTKSEPLPPLASVNITVIKLHVIKYGLFWFVCLFLLWADLSCAHPQKDKARMRRFNLTCHCLMRKAMSTALAPSNGSSAQSLIFHARENIEVERTSKRRTVENFLECIYWNLSTFVSSRLRWGKKKKYIEKRTNIVSVVLQEFGNEEQKHHKAHCYLNEVRPTLPAGWNCDNVKETPSATFAYTLEFRWRQQRLRLDKWKCNGHPHAVGDTVALWLQCARGWWVERCVLSDSHFKEDLKKRKEKVPAVILKFSDMKWTSRLTTLSIRWTCDFRGHFWNMCVN